MSKAEQALQLIRDLMGGPLELLVCMADAEVGSEYAPKSLRMPLKNWRGVLEALDDCDPTDIDAEDGE